MKKILMVAGAITLIIVVLGAAGIAYAQGGIPPVGWTNEDGSTMPMGGGRGMRGAHGNSAMNNGMVNMAQADGPMFDLMAAAFAEALGMPLEDFQARLLAGESMMQIATSQGLTIEEAKAVMEQARQAAMLAGVEQGVLTQEQAERMNGNMAHMGMVNRSNNMHGGFAGGMDGSGPLADYLHAAMAEALGLSVEDLQDRIDAGDTAWDIVAEQGLTTEEFQALMTTARQTAIDQALADGVITAEQAERMFNGPAGAGMGNYDGQNGGGSGVPGDCPNGGGMHGRNGQP